MVTTRLTGAIAALLVSAPALAGAVELSLRPVARPAAVLSVAATDTVTPTTVVAPANSLRPFKRPQAASSTEIGQVSAATQAGFERWIAEFRPKALNRGIGAATFDRAFRNVRYDPEVIERDRNQSEFTKTIWTYLETAASDARIRNGQAALRRHGALLDRIEAQYGVDKEIVVAIWGLESAYGTFKGSKPVIQSMATLAYDGRRRSFFEGQLYAALKILDQGHTAPEAMKGSWAGAMGHTQFMPTSFQSLAVDHTGDGRRDIWGDDPADALASTANYLAKNGWRKGLPWGVEVRLPEGFDYAQANRGIERMPSVWAQRGVLGIDGQPVRDYGVASVLLPAGHEGAAFLVFRNFAVIERYNTADAYVIGVGHLADRIKGGGPIRSGWPTQDRALTLDERMELQRRLTARGFDTRGIDGKIGPLTIDAVRGFQRSLGLPPDGYASPRLLNRLR
ncbi:lytic murein transglycosylase [Thalassococcus sp. CAU 1522]|uniref:Lytic murein transglycosylase n=1 Tax=Thalassococcus arenae TaxID=2851652 RepID=A0ABS6N6N4_9RHOB|nr:lytic murein transglycosylase [Thalassococcus arenae]MBV2359680.1 lytic murein transglycosylase [Thalassococcus arenae]